MNIVFSVVRLSRVLINSQFVKINRNRFKKFLEIKTQNYVNVSDIAFVHIPWDIINNVSIF